MEIWTPRPYFLMMSILWTEYITIPYWTDNMRDIRNFYLASLLFWLLNLFNVFKIKNSYILGIIFTRLMCSLLVWLYWKCAPYWTPMIAMMWKVRLLIRKKLEKELFLFKRGIPQPFLVLLTNFWNLMSEKDLIGLSWLLFWMKILCRKKWIMLIKLMVNGWKSRKNLERIISTSKWKYYKLP